MSFLYCFFPIRAILFYFLLLKLFPFTAFLLSLFPLLPDFSRLLPKMMSHNETPLSDCHNLPLALWPTYMMKFVGLQVFMWEKGREHLLVTDQTERDPGRSVLWIPNSAEVCWCFPLWPVCLLVKASWFVGCFKYPHCQDPWHCLNGLWAPMKRCCILAEWGDRDGKPHNG